jgi:hypothetical protein
MSTPLDGLFAAFKGSTGNLRQLSSATGIAGSAVAITQDGTAIYWANSTGVVRSLK